MTKYRFAALWAVAAMLAVSLPAAGNELVTNGKLETGDFTDLPQSGNIGPGALTTNSALSGAFVAQFGPAGSNGGNSQLSNTHPAHAYTLTFWARPQSGQPNSFSVLFNGKKPDTITNQPDPVNTPPNNSPGDPVPEPASLALFSAGLCCIGLLLRRKRKSAQS